jgi:hypothetical protein
MTETTEAKWYYADGGRRTGPMSRAELEELIQNGKVTATTSVYSGEGDWRPAQESELASLFAATPDNPPPLSGKDVDNKFIWAVVAVPIVGVVIELIAGMEFVWLYIVANIVCCILDERKLKAAGHKAPETVWAFLVPVYLWKRANFLSQKKHYFWGWMAAFVLSILIGMGGYQAALEEAAAPLVTQILEENLTYETAKCKAVVIDEEVSDGFYKATATLDTGEDIMITIEETDDGQILVKINLNQ